MPFTTRTIKGISYAFFDAATGSYSAAYLAAQWAIQDSNLGPLPYQRSALTD